MGKFSRNIHNEESPIKQKKQSKKHTVKRVFRALGFSLLVITVISATGVGVIYVKFKPTIDKARSEAFAKESSITGNIFRRASNSVVLNNKGEQIAKVSGNDYKYVEIGDVSSDVTNGYIAIENKDFLTEPFGISFKGMARAGYEYVLNKGKITSGGSTITQQLIKNVLLTQERTMDRKITEIFLAPEIERRYSKSQIMEYYINNCYYGEGSYGIESAAQHFFSKPASKLSLSEAALLAGLSNNPTMWSPTQNPNDSKTRRNLVLKAMLDQKYITQEEYESASKEEINLNIQATEEIEENYASSYAVDCTVRELMKQDGFAFKYVFTTDTEEKEYKQRYREEYMKYDRTIRSGGYTIHTSIDEDKQSKLQKAVDSGLSDFTETDVSSGKYSMQGSAVSIDNSTGYVVAIVGGRGETDKFNRGFLAHRQPGSAIKPTLDYAPYFDRGYHPLSQVVDEPINNGPMNDDRIYRGRTTLRNALEISINTIPFRMLSEMKASNGLEYLAKMKFSGLHPTDNTPIISIGGFTEGVSPVEQAGSFYALENNGYFVEPSCITQIDYYDSAIYKNKQLGTQVYSPEAAYMTTDILKGVIESEVGTGRSLKVGDHFVAGKTGTTSDNKDGWFCGYSKYYTTVVWCGYDTPRSVNNLYGATYPGHIWQDYMLQVHEGLAPKDFKEPAGIVWKNIDGNGNLTSNDTGMIDMFSQPLLNKQEEEAEKERLRIASEKQADWDSHEGDRQQAARSLLEAYSDMTYNTEADLDIVDRKYNEVLNAISVVDDNKVAEELQTKALAHRSSIERQRNNIVQMIEQEKQAKLDKIKADAQAKAEAEAEANKILAEQQAIEQENIRNAEIAVKQLEKAESSPALVDTIKETEDKIALVTDKDIYKGLYDRVQAIRGKYNIINQE